MRLGIPLFVSGVILLIFGISMLIPACLDFRDSNTASASAFCLSAAVTCFCALLFMATFYDAWKKLSVREMYLTTSVVWLIVCFFCALPFYFSPEPLNYTDAFFESMSGLTTFGATVISNLAEKPRGILLWRGMLHWYGGLGIIVIALAILPLLRIGGMQLFSTESSDKSGKALPKTSQIIGTLMMIYVISTTVCFVSLKIAGMTVFESLTFSLSTISTGGLTPTDNSAEGFSPVIQWLLTFFMFTSGLPLFYLYFLYKKDWQKIKTDMQVKTYVGVVILTAGALALWLAARFPDKSVEEVLRLSLFQVVSTVTTTGLTCDNYENWGYFGTLIILILLPVGACSGSTSGGIKMFRFDILYLASLHYLRSKILPHGVFVPKYNDRPLNDDITFGVIVFIAIFILSFLLSCMALTAMNIDILTSLSATISALGNTGLGLGEVGFSGGGFGSLPSAAKWILSFDMMLGRLEFMTVFVLLLPLAWKKEKKSSSDSSF